MVKKKETAFPKSQWLKSKKFVKNIDVLSVVLDEKKTYTENEVRTLINKFLNRKV